MLNEFMKPLIEAGMVYLTYLPLYRVVTTKKETYYYYTDEEYQNGISKLIEKKAKFTSSRFKGLAEMNAEDLHELAFRKESRKLIQVSIDDAEYCSDMVDKIMGKTTDYRKQVLLENNNVDVDEL